MSEITNPKIDVYCSLMSEQPSVHCQDIARYTRRHISMHQMLIGSLEASFLKSLIRLKRAKRILEIGCFTGYSALSMAEALPKTGSVTTLDINPTNGQIARDFWAKSPHGNKIELILGDARKSICALNEKFDFIFIDADKGNYLYYLKESLKRLALGGMIVVDNCLWGGRVLDRKVRDHDTLAIQRFNQYVSRQEKLFVTLVPIRDGIYLIQKKP